MPCSTSSSQKRTAELCWGATRESPAKDGCSTICLLRVSAWGRLAHIMVDANLPQYLLTYPSWIMISSPGWCHKGHKIQTHNNFPIPLAYKVPGSLLRSRLAELRTEKLSTIFILTLGAIVAYLDNTKNAGIPRTESTWSPWLLNTSGNTPTSTVLVMLSPCWVSN